MRHRLAALLLSASACATTERPPAPRTAATAPSPLRGAGCGEYGDDAPAALTPLGERTWLEVQRRLRGTGTPIRRSGALDRAAGALSLGAAQGASDPLSRQRIQDALRTAGAFDPAPTAHLASGTPDALLAALLARVERNDATHVGVGERDAGGVHHVVLLFSHRRARIDLFPGQVAPGSSPSLRGELLGLLQPRAYVTGPDGSAAELRLEGGRGFSGRVPFPLPGRYGVEVMGTGERGPEVAALLGVTVGGAACASPPPSQRPAEPDAIEAAEASVVEAANRTRRERGLAPLTPSAELSAVARRHSEQMRAAGVVAHVLPADGDLTARLAAARIGYRKAFENVASGASSLDAHAAIEASPAHRSSLLQPAARRLGVGIARGALPTGERVAWLTEVLVEPAADPSADRLTPDARAAEALWDLRARRSLPPLTRDPALEAIAREGALSMRDADRGELGDLAARALRLGRGLAATDAFIASSPGEVVRSANATDPRFRRVGVAAVAGDSPRFGPARLYIVVLYSD